jgi:hypothetical protein
MRPECSTWNLDEQQLSLFAPSCSTWNISFSKGCPMLNHRRLQSMPEASLKPKCPP